MAEKKSVEFPFSFGGDPAVFCEECQIPCNLDEMTIDCHRRLFLRGMLNCSYFVFGYCFLIDIPGCVFDNSGRHDTYWLQLLNKYHHNVEGEEKDEKYLKSAEEARKLIDEQIERHNVFLCRYIEEYYNQVMETGGGLSDEMISGLDEAYLLMLRGISRKPD